MSRVEDYRRQVLELWQTERPLYVKKIHDLDVGGGAGILAIVMHRYVDLRTSLLNGDFDQLSENDFRRVNQELNATYDLLRPLFGKPSNGQKAIAWEQVSGMMHDSGYSPEVRAQQHGEARTTKMGKPLTEQVLRRRAEALALYLMTGNYNEVADFLCGQAKHNPHKAAIGEENPCANRFRKEATKLKKFLDMYGYAFDHAGPK